ncbi:AfsR/SARP family transcriptional regulator [Micromonospora sp. NPDC051296]|uniref:AfsR/SARP family transcriptional regulator n=1 Tax=Micromonospora sp. NPDC051296 TaxID=3155046 RepID=UPI0034194E45
MALCALADLTENRTTSSRHGADAGQLPVTFRLLGPFEVSTPKAAPLPVPRGRARALLALLLLNPNAVVSGDEIVDGVWGEHPPATVRTQVHVRVSLLRRFLDGLGDVSIETHPAGYRLTIDPVWIDLATFLHLARTGNRALADNRPDAAAHALHRALALWRGAALGGVRAPFASSAAVQLEEQWLTAHGNRVDADLELGRHQELIPELRALLMQRPLLEIARAQLITAMHRAGRRADALAIYQEGARLLRDELGVDPGPDLTRAYWQLIAPSDLPARRGGRSADGGPGWPALRARSAPSGGELAGTQPKPAWWRVKCAAVDKGPVP